MRVQKWIVMACMTFSTQAQFENILISNASGSYQDPSGSVTVGKVNTNSLDLSNLTIKIEKEESQFRLSYDGEEMVLEDLPDIIVNASKATMTGFNFKGGGNQAKLALTNFEAISDLSELQITGVWASCDKLSQYTGEYEKYLDACTTNSTVTLENLTFSSEESVSQMMGVLGVKSSKDEPTVIENLDLEVDDNDFTASLRVGVSVTANGKVNYKKVDGKNMVEFKVDRVRSGFFNVTNTFFNTLEDISVEGIEIDKPYIRISF